jgi:ATP-dependent protease ClpP protease subunit
MRSIMILLFALLFSMSVNAKEITLTADNTAVLRTSFNSQSVTELKKDLVRLNSSLESGYPIYLVLYTPGGDVQKGLELFEFIKGLNRPVHTITIFAASMGFQTVQHLGTRYILNYGVLMSHYARGGSSGTFGGTNMPSQKRSYDKLWERRIDMMDIKTVERTKGKQTLDSYRKAYSFDLWLNGPEAVAGGYADAIATVKCDPDLLSADQQKEVTFRMMFFRVKAKFSGCPLITSPVGVSGQLLTNKGYMDVEEFLSKNGKFGEKCDEKGRSETKDWNGNVVPAKEAELCAYDKKATVDSIRKTVEEKERFLNRNLRDHVEYSY